VANLCRNLIDVWRRSDMLKIAASEIIHIIFLRRISRRLPTDRRSGGFARNQREFGTTAQA